MISEQKRLLSKNVSGRLRLRSTGVPVCAEYTKDLRHFRHLVADDNLDALIISKKTRVVCGVAYRRYWLENVNPVPHVVLKEQGSILPRLVVAARESGITVCGHKHLANILFSMYECGDEIMPELYESVAEILAASYRETAKRVDRRYMKSAHEGNPDAQFMVGFYADDGDVRLEWMKKAADNGHPKAQYYIGKAYEHGLQVTANPDKANNYYRLAAHQGNLCAAYALEHMGLGADISAVSVQVGL